MVYQFLSIVFFHQCKYSEFFLWLPSKPYFDSLAHTLLIQNNLLELYNYPDPIFSSVVASVKGFMSSEV